MSLGSNILILLGMLALVFVICLGTRWLERRFPDDYFDERQKIARGKAYRLSDSIGEIYFFLLALYLMKQDGGEGCIAPYILVLFGVVLKLLVFRVYCVLTHSDTPLGEKPYLHIILRLSIGILALGLPYRWKSLDPGVSGGMGDAGASKVLIGIFILSWAAIDIFHILWENKE